MTDISDEKIKELEAKALAEIDSLRGKIVLVKAVTGYVDCDSKEFDLDPPARMRVTGGDHEHWNGEWLDPYINLELVEPHPQLEGARSFFWYGTSYNAKTGRTQGGSAVVLDPNQEPPPAPLKPKAAPKFDASIEV